jgi:hypothetical protein
MATKQQPLTISISTINDTDYFGKCISIYFFRYNFQIVWYTFIRAFKVLATLKALRFKLVARAKARLYHNTLL